MIHVYICWISKYEIVSNCTDKNSFNLNSTLTLRKHAINSDFKSCKKTFKWKILDIFLNFAQNIDCKYTLEPPRRGGSNEYPLSMF